MRYREIIQNKLDRLEAQVKVLEFMVKRQEPVDKFIQVIKEVQENLSDTKSYFEKEPAGRQERSGLH